MPFEATAWRILSDGTALEQERLKRQIHDLLSGTLRANTLVGYRLNLESPRQLLATLADLGIAVPDTHEATLQAVKDRHPVIPLLLAYREAAKRAGTYGIEFLARHVHPTTGRIHADYRQIGAASGRMSCTNPNMQNIPRTSAYRACFRAPAGSALVKADYAQIELRLAAVIAGDDAMLAAYREGADLHTRTAATVLGISADQVSREHRQLAKALNFGLLYGMGAAGLQQYAAAQYGVAMGLEDAEAHRGHFFAAYPGLRRWHRSQADGAITTRTLAGRQRLAVARFTEKLNTPVQGSGADGLKAALGRLWRHRAETPSVRLVATVHDEIVAECPAADAPAVAEWLSRHMEAAMSEIVDGRVPIVVEASIARDWAGTPLEPDGAHA
jgi:DNA polymerase-1